ncbi:MAG: small basic protein [Gemmataceae bacterium]
MSIDKSLRRRASLMRQRSVLTRAERIKILQEQDRWTEGRSPFGLPKVRVRKVVLKKAKKAKEEAAPAAQTPATPAETKEAKKK